MKWLYRRFIANEHIIILLVMVALLAVTGELKSFIHNLTSQQQILNAASTIIAYCIMRWFTTLSKKDDTNKND
jgi:hypothetical protein